AIEILAHGARVVAADALDPIVPDEAREIALGAQIEAHGPDPIVELDLAVAAAGRRRGRADRRHALVHGQRVHRRRSAVDVPAEADRSRGIALQVAHADLPAHARERHRARDLLRHADPASLAGAGGLAIPVQLGLEPAMAIGVDLFSA